MPVPRRSSRKASNPASPVSGLHLRASPCGAGKKKNPNWFISSMIKLASSCHFAYALCPGIPGIILLRNNLAPFLDVASLGGKMQETFLVALGFPSQRPQQSPQRHCVAATLGMCSDLLRRGAPCALGPFIIFANPPSGCSPTRHSSPDFQSVLRCDPLPCVHRLPGPPERTVVLVPSAGCTASPPQHLCVRRLLITNATIVGGHGGREGGGASIHRGYFLPLS